MRRALKILAALLFVVVAALLVFFWWSGRESALQWLARAAIDRSNGALQISGVSGSLYGPLAIAELVFEDEDRRLAVRGLELDWVPRALFDRHLHISRFNIAELQSYTKKKKDEPPKFPESLALPITFDIQTARIGKVLIADAKAAHELSDVSFSVNYDGDIYAAKVDSLRSRYGSARAEATLSDEEPFSVAGSASVFGEWQGNDYGGELKAGGNLASMNVDATAASGRANAYASGVINPFNKLLPIAEMRVSANGIDPAQFREKLPHADVAIDLSARSEGGKLIGKLKATNAIPAASDQNRLPVKSLGGSFSGLQSTFAFSGIEIVFHEGGSVSGDGNFVDETLRLDLDADSIDLHALHSSLHPTRLNGNINLAANATSQSIDAALKHDKLDIGVSANHNDGTLTISRGELRSGRSELQFAGKTALKTPYAFDLEARLTSFNPADFGKFPAARVNAVVNAVGEREPDLRAQLTLTMRDSRWRDVPLRGEGKLTVVREAIEHAYVDLRAGTNRIAVDGAFGRKSDTLRFTVAAPHLSQFGQPWQGRLNAKGTLSGALTDAILDLDVRAANLKAPAQVAVGKLEATIDAEADLKRLPDFSLLDFSASAFGVAAGARRIGGLQANGKLREGIDGAVSLKLDARDVESGELKLTHADVSADGTRAAHRIKAAGTGSDLDFAAALQGGLRADKSWSGELTKLSNKGRYPIALVSPARLLISPPRFAIEDAELEVAGGKVSLQNVAFDDGSIESKGSVRAFPVAYLVSLTRQNALQSDLVIGGEWNFRTGATVDGRVAIQRESGDVILDKKTDLGLTGLDFSATARNSNVDARMNATGGRLGTIVAAADLSLAKQGGRWNMSRSAPLSAAVDASIPSIAWLGELAKFKGSIDGALKLNAKAQGSFDHPQISAQLVADDLSGARAKLDGGKLRASIDANAKSGSSYADVVVSMHASTPSYGTASGEARIQLVSRRNAWSISPDAPIAADIRAEMPSIAWISSYVPNQTSLGGAFSLRAKAAGSWRAPTVSASLTGDGLSARSPQTEIALDGGTLRAILDASPITGTPNAEVKIAINANAPPYGDLKGEAKTRLTNSGTVWGVARDAPIDAQLLAAMPSLQWTRAVLPPGVAVEGGFNVQATASGTLGNPGMAGVIRGDRLRVQHLDSGLDLKEGVLRAELKDRSLLVNEFTMHGGEGTLSADGSAALDVVKIRVRADKLMALSRPDRSLVLTGDGDVAMREKKLVASAKVTADRALIELPDDNTPALGRDVVVADGREKSKRASDLSAVHLSLEFDLGESFVVKGKGLDAKLAGLIHLNIDGTPPPTAKGTIRVAKGTYAAYGQRLEIERGVVNFSGPIDNPGLDIVAMRKNQPVEAGVAITGTALNPRLTLISDPVVPDTEKVSWLVLGHGLSGSNKNDLALVQAAAGALLAQGQSVSLQQRVAQATGLDEVGITGSGLEGSVLALGKRLSSRVYLTFERGLTGASNIAKLRYALSPRWSLETKAGSDTALDLFYTLSFD